MTSRTVSNGESRRACWSCKNFSGYVEGPVVVVRFDCFLNLIAFPVDHGENPISFILGLRKLKTCLLFPIERLRKKSVAGRTGAGFQQQGSP